jgi:hypothetical protein
VRAPGGKRRIAPGALCCRSGSPPIPAETRQRYSKRSLLTVLLRTQVQKYFLAILWLILVGAMASAIRQFLGSDGASGGTLSWQGVTSTGGPSALMGGANGLHLR